MFRMDSYPPAVARPPMQPVIDVQPVREPVAVAATPYIHQVMPPHRDVLQAEMLPSKPLPLTYSRQGEMDAVGGKSAQLIHTVRGQLLNIYV